MNGELCDCASRGFHCLGRRPGKLCMAHDKWYDMPCHRGQCPGPMNEGCCHAPHPDAWMDEIPEGDRPITKFL